MTATNCLEYGITVNNVSICTTVYTRIEKGTGTLTFAASTGVRAYYGGRSSGCAAVDTATSGQSH